MLAFWLGRLDNKVDKSARDSHMPGLDRAAADEALCLADDETTGIMRRLGDRERIQGNGLVIQRTIAVRIDGTGAKDADVNLEAAIEHELLIVDALDGDVVRRMVSCRLVDFAGFEPGIDERPEADARQVARPARRDRSIERRD